MKVLIVNNSDVDGGASRAAYRLHESLLEKGLESNMLVQFKKSNDPTVVTYSLTKFQKLITKLVLFLDSLPVRLYRKREKKIFSPSFFGRGQLIKEINKINPDIVHIHWINNGMIKITDLKQIKAPIVWSLHDMWPFTGGCHYSNDCIKFLIECGNCPALLSGKNDDLSKKVFDLKKKNYPHSNITIVGLSRWLSQLAENSYLFKDMRNVNLPNPINVDLFKPKSKYESRDFWKLPHDKKLVLFGAMAATSDPRKGFYELVNSLREIKTSSIELVIFGSDKPEKPLELGFKTHYMGALSCDKKLRTLYSAADVMIVPSLQENLSNAIMESLACGTPVVAFDIGGNSDMVDHKLNGYLAEPFDSKDLAEGIDWVLQKSDTIGLGQNSRRKVVTDFNAQEVSKSYIALYEEILGV